jgi:hypothetical protein
MKKLVALLTFLCGVVTCINLFSAEAASPAHRTIESQKKAILPEGLKNALFMLGHHNRISSTFFDTYRFGPADLAYTGRIMFPPTGNNQLDAIQFGPDYYIFVPDTAANRVLVFTAQEDGQFQFLYHLAADQAPMDVSVVEHHGILYLFVANATNSVEVLKFDGKSWQRTSALQVLDRVEPRRSRDDTIWPLAIKAIRFNKKVYLFMVHERVDHLMMGSIDDDGQLQSMVEVDVLPLPINQHANQRISYTLEAAPCNNVLYLFIGGESGDWRDGFTRIGRMTSEGAVEDVTPQTTRENKLIPNSMAVVEVGNNVHVYVSFYDVTQVEVYTLSSTGLTQRAVGLAWFPLQMRMLKDNGKNYLIVLRLPRSPNRNSIGVYAVQSDGTLRSMRTDVDFQAPHPQIPLLYQNFTIIPYYGQTKQEVEEAIEVAKERSIPEDLVRELSEFVTPVP